MGPQRVAFHSPCTLQHGSSSAARSRRSCEALGLELTPVADAHLCCGSAGTYSILQPELAARAQGQQAGRARSGCSPDVIATANIGCLTHLAGGTRRDRCGTGSSLFECAAARSRPAMHERRCRRAADARDYRHFLAIPTRWMDNDSYGHVNNVIYYSYFDTVVNEHLIRAGGLDIRDGPAIGLVVETCCRFHRPLSFPGDRRRRACASRSLGTSSVTLRDRPVRRGRRRRRRRPGISFTSGSIAPAVARRRCPARFAPRWRRCWPRPDRDRAYNRRRMPIVPRSPDETSDPRFVSRSETAAAVAKRAVSADDRRPAPLCADRRRGQQRPLRRRAPEAVRADRRRAAARAYDRGAEPVDRARGDLRRAARPATCTTRSGSDRSPASSRCTDGGATRGESVRNGLAAIGKRAAAEDWVLVHDAARPCIDVDDA